MVTWYADNDGTFPTDTVVLVRYPLQQRDTDRQDWPWLPGTIIGQCGTGEWHVVVDGRGDLAQPAQDDPRGVTYPACYRDATELRLIDEDEWGALQVPLPAELAERRGG